ncbi:SGS domain-containing protein [Xylariales sp. AK1849]|nr:SGS domain-containing protein [Xylariales sp. AK1849]
MSAQNLANEGVRLVQSNKYAEGIEKLTQALKSRSAPKWLLERSKAYLRTKEFDLALHDAETALSVAFKRANRDLMIEAQIRRAITLFRMGRYADADVCAFWAMQLVTGAKASDNDGQQNKVDNDGDYTVTLKDVEGTNTPSKASDGAFAAAMGAMDSGRTKDTANRNQAFTWRIQALTQMVKLEAGATGRKVSVVKYPTPSEAPPTKDVELDDSEPDEEPTKSKIPSRILNMPEPKDPVNRVDTWDDIWNIFRAVHAKNDIRTDFYQSDTTLNVSFFVKNVSKDGFEVDAHEQSVSFGPLPNLPSVTLNLAGDIKPAETTYTVKSMKIELVLKKAVPGRWPVLRKGTSSMFDNITIGQATHGTKEEFVAHAKKLGYEDPSAFSRCNFHNDLAWYNDLRHKLFREEGTDAPGPTSAPTSKPAPTKDSAPVYPTSSKSGPKDWDAVKLDDDDDSKEDVEDFFKKLYKDADPDTRRAMMKSYTQSNGTSLSTNWAEAGKKDYETEPPDSMEAKTWDK